MTDEGTYKTSNKICRLCLKSCENSVSIFDPASIIADKPLKECIEDIGRISLSPLDNLPETACQLCYRLLADTYSFVGRIRKNDEFLHNILQCDDESNSPENVQLDLQDSGDIHPENIVQDQLEEHGPESDTSPDCGPEEGELPQYYEITILEPTTVDLQQIHSEEQQTHQPSTSSIIRCSYCPKTFVSARNKREHERAHFEEGRKCPHCEKRFVKKCNWTRHVNSHTFERTFICTTCTKIFVTQAELNRHMKIHNPVRDYKCEYCVKEFKHVDVLKFHIRTVHFKERPFCCPNCGQAFSTASKVRRHQKTKLCAETKSITTVHHGCEEQFIIVENNFHEIYKECEDVDGSVVRCKSIIGENQNELGLDNR